MASTTTQPGGTSLVEVAAAGGTSHTHVRRILVRAFPALVGGKNRIPRDMGDLLGKAFKGRALAQSTGDMLREDPAAVLTAAEALAELARRAMADPGRGEPPRAAA